MNKFFRYIPCIKVAYFCVFFVCVCMVLPHIAPHAQESTLTQGFPRPGSLKRDEVNIRSGPGTRYPILWVFQRKGWPVTILAKFDNWYKIRDLEGEEGWVYLSMVSSQNTAVVTLGLPLDMFKKDNGGPKVFRLEPGVVVDLDICRPSVCKVSVNKKSGWVSRARLNSIE